MPCPDCSPNNISNSNYQTSLSSGCSDCHSTGNFKYDGPNLNCSSIETCDNLNDALSKLDTALCTVVGDYSTYNKYCLDDVTPILTAQQFIESISQAHCNLKTSVETFQNTTFPNYQIAVDQRFDDLEIPGITCTSAGVIPTDTLETILIKYCNKFGSIDSLLNMSSVDWDKCFTVPVAPTNLTQGLNLLIDQICEVKATGGGGSGTLPVFNNVGSCLATPSTTDSLINTINKIKVRLCQSPVFDINALTWTCVNKPSSTTTDLQAAFQSVLAEIATLKQNLPTFDNAQFTVSNVDNGNLCLGKSVQITSLSSPTDRFVAVNVSDTSPGYLATKLQAGANITLDSVSVVGKVIISSSGSGVSDEKVKLNLSDPTAGYLVDKIVAGPIDNGITINVVPDTGTGELKISASLDMATLIINMFNEIDNNPEFSTLLCNLMAKCPSPCEPPSNVNVTYTP